jgi:hypothetical protein
LLFAREGTDAASGDTGALLPFLQRRIIPTAAVHAAVMSRLMPKRRMPAGSKRIVTYDRHFPNGSRPIYYGKPWFLPLAVLFYEMLDRWDQR